MYYWQYTNDTNKSLGTVTFTKTGLFWKKTTKSKEEIQALLYAMKWNGPAVQKFIPAQSILAISGLTFQSKLAKTIEMLKSIPNVT